MNLETVRSKLSGRERGVDHVTEFTIQFKAAPSRIPAIARLRRLLKFAGRACGLRCIRVEENPKGNLNGDQTNQVRRL